MFVHFQALPLFPANLLTPPPPPGSLRPPSSAPHPRFDLPPILNSLILSRRNCQCPSVIFQPRPELSNCSSAALTAAALRTLTSSADMMLKNWKATPPLSP